MNINEVKQVFASQGKSVTDCGVKGYYKIDGGNGKHRSKRSLTREAKSIVKKLRKVPPSKCIVCDQAFKPGEHLQAFVWGNWSRPAEVDTGYQKRSTMNNDKINRKHEFCGVSSCKK